MSANPQQTVPSSIGTPGATIPMGLRILAIILRALFIGALVAVTVRVSSPQSESLASVYETPGDLIRLALGFAVCLWIVIRLFMLPRTAEGYRTWVYLGLVVAPLAWAVAIAHLVMHRTCSVIEQNVSWPGSAAAAAGSRRLADI